jgi:hypothetical protein
LQADTFDLTWLCVRGKNLAGLVGLKPTTCRVETGCSLQLSYRPGKKG